MVSRADAERVNQTQLYEAAVRRELSVVAATDGVLAAEIDPLHASKFAVPEAPPFMVMRGRLLDRISDAVRNPLTAVTGPPGSGKTQLAASWVSSGRAPGPVVWITLEDGDDEPGVFWPYLVEGLRRSGIALSPTIDEAGCGGTFDRSLLARLAADLAAQPMPVVLVLDSVSVLSDRQLAEDLDALLRHADQHLRMILVGRWDPPMPLYRYRLAGTLSEVRGDDLAFSAIETGALLAGHGVELPDVALTSLVERTEGWAAGLRLFAMALEGRGDAEDLVATIAGDDANIAEYFLGEVMSAQPPEIRGFLLRTSIVDAFTPELAEALTGRGGARHTLAVLERANAFVQPVARHSTVHRYHWLFAELLRAQLADEEPAEVPRLHQRAAAWFAAKGRTADAIRHAVDARDWEHASALVIQDLGVGRLLAGGDADRLGSLFRDMPAGADGLEPALVMAALRFAGADPHEGAKHLARAEGFVDADPSEQTVPLRLAAALLGAVAATMQHDVSGALCAADAAEALMAQAPPDRVAAHPELRAIMLFCRGASLSWAGAFDDAIATLTDGVRAAAAPGCDYPRLACLEQLALVNAYCGRLREAADVAGQAVQLADQRGRTPPHPSLAAAVVLAWVACERWDVAAASRHLRAAEAAVDTREDPMATVAVALVRSRLLGGRGELRVAARILSEVQTPRAGRALPPWLEQEITLSLARLFVAIGAPDEALAAVNALDDRASAQAVIVAAAASVARGDMHRGSELVAPVVKSTNLPTPLLIEAWLILATAASDRGEASAARDSLRQALALATPDTHRRVFHQAGPRLRQLLRNDAELAASYRSLGASSSPQSRRQPVGAEFPAGAPIVVDPLSGRELQVLRHLAAMLGTEEIAEAMCLSVNTVKTHVRSILRKLAASRRNEAVRRARALGLI
jgi:LuxR family maltose regulon positive regulatory protein